METQKLLLVLLYTWWVCFTTASDRQRLEAVIRRAKRSCLCSSDLPSLAELIDSADDELFHSILYNPHHVLHCALTKETCSSYGLRRRRHNRELLNKSSRLVQSCFLIQRHILIIQGYIYQSPFVLYSYYRYFVYFAFCQSFLLKFYWLIDVLGCYKFVAFHYGWRGKLDVGEVCI